MKDRTSMAVFVVGGVFIAISVFIVTCLAVYSEFLAGYLNAWIPLVWLFGAISGATLVIMKYVMITADWRVMTGEDREAAKFELQLQMIARNILYYCGLSWIAVIHFFIEMYLDEE